MKTHTFFLSLIILTTLSCQRFIYKNYNEAKAKNKYDLSLEKTSDVSKERIVNNLLSPTLDSSQLTYKNIGGKNYILVVMWKKEGDLKYYKNDCTSGIYNTQSRYNFVTIVPQLKNICRKKNFGISQGVSLRLEELLGLPQKSQKDYFVEAWVQPEDLIRPCRDKEITDRTCGLALGDTTMQEYKTYLGWLSTGNAGYPFTQLGYTYDWKKRNGSHEGLSEFLIDQQSNIVIKDYIETCDYCYVSKVRKERNAKHN
ncbi:MAG: hypothetical protein IPP15_00640 [Saprospiraceae bacterium]|uniref:Lipoprotein n=1 Tax=Candidatus Opimibacter skivensis TaxID=2982028 RepID=A0A9D7SRG2_9BACT|nr:hypothetical protein [Candidatus Opimibacter skivensis]